MVFSYPLNRFRLEEVMDVHEKYESASQVPRRRLAEIRVTYIRITNTRETLLAIGYSFIRELL